MFSKATEYALRAIIYIAQKSTEEQKLSLKEIAENIGSPIAFTAKILQTLSKKGKIIRAGRGVNGGYYLVKEARQFPISRILVAMGDDSTILNCVLGLPNCSDERPCPMHKHYKNIKPQLYRMFEETSIESLVNDMNTQNIFLHLEQNTCSKH